MKFFLDSANLNEIKTVLSWGLLDGVTTNPSLVAKEGKAFGPMVKEICQMVPGDVSLEAVSTTAAEMIKEGRMLREYADNVVVKLPMCQDALQATTALAKEGIRVNMTLVFSPLQGLLAAKAGAAYVSPFVGRLDDVSQIGMSLIEQLVTIYDNYGFDTEILVASVRSPIHILESAMMGADVATIPFSVMQQLCKHPLTDAGIAKFLEDWKKVPQ